jgi:hypothetical protein
MLVNDSDIARVDVERTFSRIDPKTGKLIWHKRGDTLTREVWLKEFGHVNRKAFIENHQVVIRYGVSAEKGARFIIREKDGYSVIEGRKINNKPLSREEAQELLEVS